MPHITLTDDQKRQLVGWLNREKDHLLSLTSVAKQIITPRATGTLELLEADLLFVRRLRQATKGYDESGAQTRAPDDPVVLSEQDVETLDDIARSNRYENREPFWRSIIEAIEGVPSVDTDTTPV